MLRLILHPDQLRLLSDELARAREREIGGVLVGEQIAPDAFRLVDLSVQRSGGTASCFVCEPAQHQPFLDDFFARTDGNFSRFNYLGEWHSHPRFPAAPSEPDLRQMQALVDEEPAFRPFAILMVVRLAARTRVELCPLVFRSHFPPENVEVAIAPRPYGESAARTPSWLHRILRRASPIDLAVVRLAADSLSIEDEG